MPRQLGVTGVSTTHHGRPYVQEELANTSRLHGGFLFCFGIFNYWVFKLCLAFVVVDDGLLFFFLEKKKRERP